MESTLEIQILHPVSSRTYLKRKLIYEQGLKARYVYQVTTGIVKIYATNGHRVLIKWVARKGDLIGLAGLLNGNVHLNYAEVKSKECIVALFPAADFMRILAENDKIRFYTLNQIVKRRRWVEEHLVYMNMADTRNRIWIILTRLALDWGTKDEYGLSFECPLTQQELAQMIGVSRQTFCEVLQQLRREGIITIVQKQWTIRNLDDKIK